MTHLIHHTWLQRSFAVLAIAALLFTAGSSPASADTKVPQDITKEEGKEFCELTGGDWNDYGADGFACYYDGWSMGCDGATCEIVCVPGTPCVESHKGDDPATTPTPNPRGRGRTTISDQPVFVAPISTPTPEPTKFAAPDTQPVASPNKG